MEHTTYTCSEAKMAPQITARDVCGIAGAAARRTDSDAFAQAPTHVPLLEWTKQQTTSSLSLQPGADAQRIRCCVQPLPLRPMSLETPLAAQQRRGHHSGPAHQQILRSLQGYHLSPCRSPCTPTVNNSQCALSTSPSLPFGLSGRPGSRTCDMFNGVGADGHAVLTGFTTDVDMARKPPSVGLVAGAAWREAASTQRRPFPGPRKFSPNVAATSDGGCLTKENEAVTVTASVKDETIDAEGACLGIEEGLLTRKLLQSTQHNASTPAKTAQDTAAKNCTKGVSAGDANGRSPHDHADRTEVSAPLRERASAQILQRSVRLLHEQLHSSKEGRVKKEKSSKDLLELSWAGGDGRESDGTKGLYTPLTLPFILKEEAEEEDDEHKEDRAPAAEPSQKMRPRKSRRPTARHVEEANRFAAGLLLSEGGASNFGSRTNSDTWDLADGDGSKGVEFLHICFPFAFPPLDRQAMLEAEERKVCQVRRSDSDSTTASGDARAGHGSTSYSGTHTSSRGKGNFPLQPSPPLRLPELPAGRIGRLLVHRSGRVKLRLLSGNKEGNAGSQCASRLSPKTSDRSNTAGVDSVPAGTRSEVVSAGSPLLPTRVSSNPEAECEENCLPQRGDADKGITYEVNVGSECTFAQDVGCFLQDASEFLFLGRCSKRLVVAPDIKSWLVNAHRTPAAVS